MMVILACCVERLGGGGGLGVERLHTVGNMHQIFLLQYIYLSIGFLQNACS